MSHGDLLGNAITVRGAAFAYEHGARGYTWARREVSYAAARAARLPHCTCGALVTTFIHRNGEASPVDCGRCRWRRRIETGADTVRAVADQLAIDAIQKFGRAAVHGLVTRGEWIRGEGGSDATES